MEVPRATNRIVIPKGLNKHRKFTSFCNKQSGCELLCNFYG